VSYTKPSFSWVFLCSVFGFLSHRFLKVGEGVKQVLIKVAYVVECLVCFVPVLLLFILGGLFSPFLLLKSLAELSLDGILMVLILVLAGIGLYGLYRVMRLLLWQAHIDHYYPMTLIYIGCGCLACCIMIGMVGVERYLVLPVIAALHLAWAGWVKEKS